MFGFQTLTCLHNIPVVRSSTNKLHDVYAKAKDTSVLIRFPCNLAETIADKSLQIALAVANPLVKPLCGPVRVIDDFAAQKIRQMESKYPAINTPTEDVVHSLNEKTEPVRNAINSVKDTTTSTIQHGKETVSNVASATVNKASGVADSVFSFCETHVSGIQRRDNEKNKGFIGGVFSLVGSLYNYVFQTVQTSLLWFRMLLVFILLKTKQINDVVLTKMQKTPFLTVLPQRLLILTGALLDYSIGRIRPDDRTLADLKKTKQQSRLSEKKPQYSANRHSYKPEPAISTRQSVVVTQQETVVTRTSGSNSVSKPKTKPQPDFTNMTDKEELYARLAAGDFRPSVYHGVDEDVRQPTYSAVVGKSRQSAYDVVANDSRQVVDDDSRQAAYDVVDDDEDDDEDAYRKETVDLVSSDDIAQLHAHINPTDVELLYTRLPADILPDIDNSAPLTDDQQTLHARLIGAELERQGYQEGQ